MRITKTRRTLDRALLLELFVLDPNTGVLRWRVARSNRVRAGGVVGTPSGNGYLRVNLDRTPVGLHRVIYLMHYGWLPDTIDHINCDPTDNRPANLRAATQRQNMGNMRPRKRKSLGCKGVRFEPRAKKWRVQIKKHGKTTHIGYFSSHDAAKNAYATAAAEVFGEFARTDHA